MSKRMRCPQGHEWNLPDGPGSTTTDVQVLCPVCGAAVDVAASGPAAPSSEVPTHPPDPRAAGVAPAEAETVPPRADPERAAGDEGTKRPAIPGYEILDELGRGGMGMVYKARQTKLDRLVALKVLPPETANDPAFAERFGREARALARLNHPHIVTVHDFGQAEGQSYFIMEFVDGMSLRQRLRGGQLPLPETLRIVGQACDALQYAHEEGIAHRDIKPDNLLLDRKGRVKIADFGIAKLLAHKTAVYTLTGPWQVMGTLNYMAPEQLDNPQAVDHRADIYSLGVVLYEMLTGTLPLGRFALPSQKAGVDARWDEVVVRALEREPERRYQQVSELRAVLDSLAHTTGSRPTESDTTPIGLDVSGSRAEHAPSAPNPILLMILTACCIICWPIGLALLLPVSIWLWVVLRGPGGRAELRRRITKAECALRAGAGNYLLPLFGTTSGWSLIACVFGLAITFQPTLPLADLEVFDFREFNIPIAHVFGYEFSYAITAGVIFLALFLLLFLTGFIEPVSLWRSGVLILAGTGVLCVMGLGIGAMGTNGPRWSGSQDGRSGAFGFEVLGKELTVNYTLRGEFQVSGRRTQVSLPGGAGQPQNLTTVALGFPGFLIFAVGAVLLLLGTIQLRGILRRRALTRARERAAT
jgi:tRNA A-37 threonylcarbamoyl transferase component Bud32